MNSGFRPLTAAFVALLALSMGGCEITDDGASDTAGTPGGSGGAPSQPELDACRKACDDLLFFDCVDASTHEACRGVCAERSSSDVEIFAACVDNTLPACEGCYESLVDAEPVDPSGGEGSGGGESGGVTVTCEDACEEWLGDGCQPVGDFESCADFCGSLPEALHDFAVECLEARDGCMLPEECVYEEWTEE